MNFNCFMILGHLWKIPVVLVSTTAMYPWMHDTIGNPENVAFSPNNMLKIPEGNGFWARFVNAYKFYYMKFSYMYYSTEQNDLLQKYYGPDVPTIRELEQSASLVLMNTFFPINGAKPMATGVVEVGGLHIQKDTRDVHLDERLKKWLDNSNHGVVYFSLGSMFRFEAFPNATIDVMIDAFEKISPVRVLMRLAKPEELKRKLPANVHTLPWVPQVKVLRKCKLRSKA